ncbi:MAG: isoprenylcysteine carboxylmethyltransferase family protein [Terracidiphilus sp.]
MKWTGRFCDHYNLPMLQIATLVELVLCWIVWSFAFLEPRKQAAGRTEVASASVSRWGIGLVMVGFALAWAYVRPVGFEKSPLSLVASMILGPSSVALGWSAAHSLGKQWRYKAALNADHELIQTGPYRWIRHPIYASMLGMLLATLTAWTWWPMALGSLTAFLAGTEIRIHAEDRLLAGRFGESFTAYRSRVSAYIPFIR